MTSPVEDSQAADTVCYRHRNRPTNVRCQNCEKPICADCMRDSPMGYRCPDCAPQRRFALADDLAVTKTIIGLNIAVFVVGIVLQAAEGARGNFLTGSGGDLTLHGALLASTCESVFTQTGQCASSIGVADGEWWRLITGGFLHAGLLHIALNMFFIWSFGQLLEPALGRLRFSLLYLVSLLGGSIGALLLSAPGSFTVGASGAAFGLLGAGLVVARLRNLSGLTSNLLMVAVFNFGFTFIASGISVGGHIGGFIAGIAGGYVVFGPLARQRQAATIALAVAAVVLFVAGISVADMRAGT